MTEEEMIEDARVIIEELGKDTFIKVPVNQAGLQAIKKLKKEGYLITGTAIYTELQGYLAINNGADYIAPHQRNHVTDSSTIHIIKDNMLLHTSQMKC
ncbi:hypothetical protein EfmAA290_14790 [Enterococcus faecium]|nr:hypothetical protein EfmAA290_14790 [Enterococcus faecium]